jgi:hypothetical protein
MMNPIFGFQDYLSGKSSASERLADANALHGYDPVLLDRLTPKLGPPVVFPV